jgi:hypothetical protein
MNYIKIKILKFYSLISTVFENTLLRLNKPHSLLSQNGFLKIKLKNKLFENLKFEKKIDRNTFFKNLIMSQTEIKKLIEKLFIENEISDKITSMTGFNYKISYLLLYETLNIPDDLSNNEIYANNWHFDKPYSKNTLKLIVPFENIEINSGPMKILNIKNSKNFISKNTIPDLEFTGSQDDALLFFPNLCAHKAGIPKENKNRKQLMLQLNPSKKWSYSKSLYIKQFEIEPKFPLKNIFEATFLL